jgi:hypothetical protein
MAEPCAAEGKVPVRHAEETRRQQTYPQAIELTPDQERE